MPYILMQLAPNTKRPHNITIELIKIRYADRDYSGPGHPLEKREGHQLDACMAECLFSAVLQVTHPPG